MKKLHYCFYFPLFLFGSVLIAGSDADISISTESFRPSAGQSVSVTFRVRASGKVIAEIIDLDKNLVRTLTSKVVEAGFLKFEWDGKDAKGTVVRDGCYFPSIRTDSNEIAINRFQTPLKLVEIKPDYYDRLAGVLSYTLPQSSLVTVKANTVNKNKATGEVERKVQKIIVENSPRTSGKVVEYFDGYGDNGKYLPQSDFSISVQALPLPPNAIIVYGGANQTRGKI